MARVPTLPGEQVTPAPVPGVRTAFGVPNVTAGLGRGMMRFAGAMQQEAEKEKRRADQAAILRAVTAADNHRRALMYTTDGGFANKEGEAALQAREGVRQSWEVFTAKLRAGLSEDQQREFDISIAGRTARFYDFVESHTSTSLIRANEEEYENNRATVIDNMGASAGELVALDEEGQLALDHVEGALAELSQRRQAHLDLNGDTIGDEEQQQAWQEANDIKDRQLLHRKVVERLLATQQDVVANKYMDHYEQQMESTDLLRLRRGSQTVANDHTALAMADDAYARFPRIYEGDAESRRRWYQDRGMQPQLEADQVKAGRDFIRQELADNPEAREKALTFFNERVEEDRKNARIYQDQVLQVMTEDLRESGEYHRLASSQDYGLLWPEYQESFDETWESMKRGGFVPQRDLEVYFEKQAMAGSHNPAERNEFMRENLALIRDQVSKQTYEELVKLQDDLKAGLGDNHRTSFQIVSGFVDSIPRFGTAKKGTKDWADKVAYHAELTRTIKAHAGSREGPVRPLTENEIEELLAPMYSQKVIEEGFFGDTTGSIASELIDIPMVDVLRLTQLVAEIQNIDPSDVQPDDVRAAYEAGVATGFIVQ
jgi:hypothetical protein